MAVLCECLKTPSPGFKHKPRDLKRSIWSHSCAPGAEPWVRLLRFRRLRESPYNIEAGDLEELQVEII